MLSLTIQSVRPIYRALSNATTPGKREPVSNGYEGLLNISKISTKMKSNPVGWSCKIHRLHLCRGVKLPPHESPRYNFKPSDSEASGMLELWGMWSTPSLPLLPGPLWPGMVAPEKGSIYESNRTRSHLNWVQTNDLCWIELLEIELFDPLTVYRQMTNVKLWLLYSNTWNHLSVNKKDRWLSAER